MDTLYEIVARHAVVAVIIAMLSASIGVPAPALHRARLVSAPTSSTSVVLRPQRMTRWTSPLLHESTDPGEVVDSRDQIDREVLPLRAPRVFHPRLMRLPSAPPPIGEQPQTLRI